MTTFLEPEARLNHLSPRDAALESIAISLKRIADQLDGTGTRRVGEPVSFSDVMQVLPLLLRAYMDMEIK